MHEVEAELDSRVLHRMLFFTDAVFAIVLTILVLELKPPESFLEATPETLRHALPHIGAFIFSFAIIGVFWVAHMNVMRRLVRFDWPTALANLLFLLPICLLPFATAWLGVDPRGAFTWEIYCWVLLAISAANMVMVLTIYRGTGDLIAGGPLRGELRYRLVRAASPGVSFAVGLVLLAAGQTILAHFCFVLIPVLLLVARRFLKPQAVAPPAPAAPGEPEAA